MSSEILSLLSIFKFNAMDFLSNYEILELVGSGSQSRVYKAVLSNGLTVALKESIVQPNNDEILLITLRELNVLKKLDIYKCPYITQFLDTSFCFRENNLIIYTVFKFIDYDLYHYLKNVCPSGLSLASLKSLSYKLLRGIEFLHSCCVLHRDLKPANILIDKGGTMLKITDFGLSQIFNQGRPLTPSIGTISYRAPEILLDVDYSFPCDIWSAGCVIFEMIHCETLFSGASGVFVLRSIYETLGSHAFLTWPEAATLRPSNFKISRKKLLKYRMKRHNNALFALLKCMLTFSDSGRITASEALKMDFFCDIELYEEDIKCDLQDTSALGHLIPSASTFDEDNLYRELPAIIYKLETQNHRRKDRNKPEWTAPPSDVEDLHIN